MRSLLHSGRLLALILSLAAVCATDSFGTPISITPTNGTLTIYPATGTTNFITPVTMFGTAADPAGLASVFVSVNSSNAWQAVKTKGAPGAMQLDFLTSVTLTPGPNFVLVKSVTTVGGVSATARVDYYYAQRTTRTETVAPGSKVTLQIPDVLPNDTSYQWQFNEQNIPGATSTTLMIPNVSQANEGVYRVLATSYLGTMPSSEVALRVSTVVLWGQKDGLDAPVGLSGVTALAAGSDHLLALNSDGTVAAWGNWMDALMFEATNVPTGLSNVVAISACDGQNMVALSDGTVVCFGHNMPPTPSGLSNVVAVACANSIEVALKSDGTVAQWSSKRNVDATANGITGVVQIAGGKDRWAALKGDGSVFLYADDGFGNVAPTEVDGLGNVASICCGGWQCLAVMSDGTVATFGGDGTLKSGLNNVVAVASPWTTSYALKADGSVASWGYDATGQADVPSGLNASQVVAGLSYGAALVNSAARTISFPLATKVKADQTPPSLSLQTPKANSHTTSVTMTGTCTESGPLKHVYYNLYQDDPPDNPADVALTGTITAAGKNKWSFSTQLTPQPGLNFLDVWAIDDWGNQSLMVSRSFVFEVPVPLDLSIAGDGAGKVTLAPVSYTGPKLKWQSSGGGVMNTPTTVYLGETYTLTAQPMGGSSFSNWTGVLGDTTTSIVFTGDYGLSAQASFIANRFTKGWKGTYNGLFRETSAVRFRSAGALNNLVVGSKGQFTATLTLQGQKYGVSGVFSPTGDASCSANTATETWTVQMQLDFANPASGVATGTVSSSAGWTANLELYKTGSGIGGPSGRANLVVTTPNAAVATPAGYGFVQINVSGGGQAVLSGSLSDNSSIGGQWGVTKDGKIAFCPQLYSGNGMAWGWLPVAGFLSNNFNGDLVWIKKPSVGSFEYPAGFTNDFAVSGAPISSFALAAYAAATGTLTIAGGDLGSPLSFPVQLAVKGSTARLVKLSGPTNMLNISISSKGLVQGTFGETADAKSGPLVYGVMLPAQRTINGYWIGNNGVSGSVLLKF